MLCKGISFLNNRICFNQQDHLEISDLNIRNSIIQKDLNLNKGKNHNNRFPSPIPTFTGPYITHKPDIKTFELSRDDKYLILASDGLWDELNNE